jgi:ElaB/YqjD/DUF883 family membrane-anchored ribosome-binding protein
MTDFERLRGHVDQWSIDLLRVELAERDREIEQLRNELHDELAWREDMMHELSTLSDRPYAKVVRRYRDERNEARAELDDLRRNLSQRAFTAPDADDAIMLASLDTRIAGRPATAVPEPASEALETAPWTEGQP